MTALSSIRTLERFPRTLRQQDQMFGCIPTSIQAVLVYHSGTPPVVHFGDQVRSLDERTILEIFAEREDLRRICFSAVKRYVLDPYIGDQFTSTVEDRPEFDNWREVVVQQVENSLPPLISYASLAGSHIGAVVATNDVGFSIHDPWIGDFTSKSFEELTQIRRNDILRLEPIARPS